MHISETIKFAVRPVILPMLVVTLIFLITILAFPTFSLTLGEFTLIYWSLSIVYLPLNYEVRKLTKYGIEHGLEEKNPIMRKIYATRNFKEYQIILILIYVFFFVLYTIGIIPPILLHSILPSWILAVILIFPSAALAIGLYDFLNDFLQLRNKQKNQTMNLETPRTMV